MGDEPKDFTDAGMRARGAELIKQGYGCLRIAKIMGTTPDQAQGFCDRFHAFGEDDCAPRKTHQTFTDAQRIDAVGMLAAGYTYREVMAHSGARDRSVIKGWKRKFPEVFAQIKAAPGTWIPPRHRTTPPAVGTPSAIIYTPEAPPPVTSPRRSGDTVSMDQIDPDDFDAADVKAMKRRIAELEAETAYLKALRRVVEENSHGATKHKRYGI